MALHKVGMDLKIGVERETHRMAPGGRISRLSQPADLVPPFFTKDFAESQLEIVTRPHNAIPALLEELSCLTAWAADASHPELLWPFSMPPLLPPESEIEIARMGTGSQAREGELYRQGLALRYGKSRQMICGVHVNFSMGDTLQVLLQNNFPLERHESVGDRPLDARYLRLARNLYEDLPHLILFTGASPLAGGLLAEELPAAISYRNSQNGYARSEFRPYLDLVSLDSYIAAIRQGMAT
jgi:glutamate--cysteine ligase